MDFETKEKSMLLTLFSSLPPLFPVAVACIFQTGADAMNAVEVKSWLGLCASHSVQ